MKKLVLHKETLRTLQDSELRLVVGGLGHGELENNPIDFGGVVISGDHPCCGSSTTVQVAVREANGIHGEYIQNL